MSFKKVVPTGDVPSERSQFGLAAIGSKVYLFGGSRYGEAFNDLYEIDSTSWVSKKIEAKGNVPAARWHGTLTAVGSKLFLFGGEVVGAIKSNELHIFDTQTSEWSRGKETGVTPNGRSGHTATLIGDNLVIHGGEGSHENSGANATMFLHVPTLEWSVPDQGGTIPEVRTDHVAITFNGKLVIFGGYGTSTHQVLDEVWVCDFGGKRWFEMPKKGNVPEPRTGTAAWVANGKYLCIWGGLGPSKVEYNNLHYADIKAPPLNWQKHRIMPASSIPSERYFHSLVSVSDTLAVVFGGQTDSKTFKGEFFTIDTSNFY